MRTWIIFYIDIYKYTALKTTNHSHSVVCVQYPQYAFVWFAFRISKVKEPLDLENPIETLILPDKPNSVGNDIFARHGSV